MLDAVLLVLREVLEAALIMSLLLALSRQFRTTWRWSLWGAALGLLGSGWVARNAYMIAEACDGMGQELLNAGLFALVALGFICLALWLLRRWVSPRQLPLPVWLPVLFVAIVSLSLMREASEIWIYLSGFIQQPAEFRSAIMGAVIGAGIGLSLGAITYYLLIFMQPRWFKRVFLVIATLLAGGLSMQIAKQLLQVGLLDSATPVWDSSVFIAEQSWLGELLYALLGYDAQPTAIQLGFYVAAIAPILLAGCWVLWLNFRSKRDE